MPPKTKSKRKSIRKRTSKVKSKRKTTSRRKKTTSRRKSVRGRTAKASVVTKVVVLKSPLYVHVSPRKRLVYKLNPFRVIHHYPLLQHTPRPTIPPAPAYIPKAPQLPVERQLKPNEGKLFDEINAAKKKLKKPQ